MRSMTYSSLDLAREALAIGEAGLPRYSSKFSRKDYTLPQLFAILVIRQFFKLDLRGTEQLLRDFSDLRKVLGLQKVPDYSTLCNAEKRFLQTEALSSGCLELYSTVQPRAA
jgi:hypothetical protein